MKRNYSAICAAFLLCILMILSFGKMGADRQAVALADTEKQVFLTFDDGPSNRVTPKILDILDEANVKATFFIVGRNATIRKDILKRAHEGGHKLAVHSYSHVYNEIYNSADALLADIDKCNKIIGEITGAPSKIYRFPGGSFNLSPALKAAVTAHGLKYYDWNASVMDADLSNASADVLYRAAVNTSQGKNKVVLLAHDATDKITTAEALPKIIAYFRDNGYRFSTL